jgi:hypothetical protein
MTDPIIHNFDDPPPVEPMTAEEFEKLYALLPSDLQQVVAALVRRLAKDGRQQ